MPERTIVTINEFAKKIAELWNTTHGSEWNSRAAGFVIANVWTKKKGEIRIYLGEKGYVRIRRKETGNVGFGLIGLQYDFGELVLSIIKSLSEQYKIAEFEQAAEVNQTVTPEGLAAVYGWDEVLDAQQDVARENWDI